MTNPSALERLGLTPVINANGPASRLGGNRLSAAAQEAMIEAGQRFVPLNELRGAAAGILGQHYTALTVTPGGWRCPGS